MHAACGVFFVVQCAHMRINTQEHAIFMSNLKAIHQRMIEMRYKGNSYRQMSDETERLGRRLKESTLAHYFEVDGKLYLEYLEYEAAQNSYNKEISKKQFQQVLAIAGKLMRSLFKVAMKRKDYKLAFEILKEEMDRAGSVVVRKNEVEDMTDRKAMSYEQLQSELARLGIDPRSGLRVAKTKVVAN